jgi:putative ABC transport system permease protein
MKAGFYGSYATRSLARGGQRTLLAVFCIAVGVLAIVALQLVGNMVNHALTDDVRATNGGDLAVSSYTGSFPASDLAAFARLESQGVLTDYTAVAQISAETTDHQGVTYATQLWAVDPARFPLAGAPVFVRPSNGSLAALLTGTNVVATQNLLTDQHLHVGDTVAVHTTGRSFNTTIKGVIENAGLFSGDTLLMAFDSFAALPSSDPTPLGYRVIYADVPGHTDANASAAKQKLQQSLPLTSITTSKDTLQQSQQTVQLVRYFLQVVGLLALLIGGIGIVNTMQVMLHRRQTEVAILKTVGYHRRDLYLLFGIEAGILGLIGGIVGAAAGIGVSFLVKGLVQKAFILALPGTIDPFIVLSGVAIGFFTALIFGLLPIIQASQIRPIAVLRGLSEHSRSSIGLSLFLGIMLGALFFVLALSIVQNVLVSLGAVGGGGLFLLLISLGFMLVAFIMSRLPVLERFTWWYVLLEAVALALAILLIVAIPPFGVLFLTVSLIGVIVALLPLTWKANVKMALRNIGRKKARTSATLVALFVGVFSVGLILTLGSNLQSTINSLASSYTGGYNTIIQASSSDKAAVDRELTRVSGIDKQTVNTFTSVVPLAIDGRPIAQFLKGQSKTQLQNAITDLGEVTGYNLAQKQFPTQSIAKGRKLTREDAGTSNALVSQSLAQAPFNVKVGDQITLAGPDGKTTATLTIAGLFTSSSTGFGAPSFILGDVSLTNVLTRGHPLYLYSLVVAPSQASRVLHQLQQALPAAQVVSIAQELASYLSLLNNLVIMFTAVASLALLAGLIIIANAVALAMLERRRELGILKALGYTSKSVLGEVLLENGMLGFVGAVLAMLLATLGAVILTKALFHLNLNINPALVLIIVAGTAAVCMLVAGLVAWSATRFRPLEVLRYE